MDILFIFKNADVGGAERVQLEILKIAKENSNLMLFTHKSYNSHFLKLYEQYATIMDISLFSNNILGRWITAGYMQKTIENSQIKLVFGSLSGLIYDIVPTIKSKKTKFLDLFHAFDGNIEFYSLRAVKHLDKRIVIDLNTRQMLIELYKKSGYVDKIYTEKIILIENGVKIPNTLPLKEYNGKTTVLFVGRDTPVKRVHLVRAMAKKAPYVNFMIAGVESHKDDPKNLQAMGKIEDIAKFYKQAHLLVLPSKREGFPMVVMEAMAYGVIPICTNVGGISRHIVDSNNGFLIDKNEEDEIVEAFLSAISMLDHDRSTMKYLAQNSYFYAKEHFSLKRFEQKYHRLFLEYIGVNHE